MLDMDGLGLSSCRKQLYIVGPLKLQLSKSRIQRADTDPPIDGTISFVDKFKDAVVRLKGEKQPGVC